MLGIFIHEISAVQDPATSNLRRSKWRRTVPQELDDGKAEEEPEVDEEETDQDSDYAEDEDEEEWISSSEDGGSDQGTENEDGRDKEEDSDDLAPLSTRLKEIQSAQSKASRPDTGGRANSIGGTKQAAQNKESEVKEANKPGIMNTLRSKLKLPDIPTKAGQHADLSDKGKAATAKNMVEGCTSRGKSPATLASVAKSSSWDFPPPGFDIMKSIEEPTPPGEGTSGSHQNQVPSTATAMPNTFNTKTASSGIPAPHPPKKVEIGSFVYLNRQHNYFHLAFLFPTLLFSFQFCEHNSISL